MSKCSDPSLQCVPTPTKCTTKDYDGSWVKGQSCDGGKTCNAHAVGTVCYSQCIDGFTKCHSTYPNYL